MSLNADANVTSPISWNELNPVITFANRLPCPPGFVFGPRFIAAYQFIYVASGSGSAQIQNRRYKAKPGDLFFYGPRVAHRFEADRQRPFVLYGIHFWLNGAFPENGRLSATDITPVADLNAGLDVPNRLQIGSQTNELDVPEYWNDHSAWIEAYVARMVRIWEEAEISAHMLNRALFTQFLLKLKSACAAAPGPGEQPSAARTMGFVMEQLKQRAALPYDRAWLKEWTHYHENHASRLFLKQFGVSPHEYFMEQKMNLAKEWLADSDDAIGDIAERLHVSSIHYFSLLFKQRTGCAPSEYRKLRRNI